MREKPIDLLDLTKRLLPIIVALKDRSSTVLAQAAKSSEGTISERLTGAATGIGDFSSIRSTFGNIVSLMSGAWSAFGINSTTIAEIKKTKTSVESIAEKPIEIFQEFLAEKRISKKLLENIDSIAEFANNAFALIKLSPIDELPSQADREKSLEPIKNILEITFKLLVSLSKEEKIKQTSNEADVEFADLIETIGEVVEANEEKYFEITEKLAKYFNELVITRPALLSYLLNDKTEAELAVEQKELQATLKNVVEEFPKQPGQDLAKFLKAFREEVNLEQRSLLDSATESRAHNLDLSNLSLSYETELKFNNTTIKGVDFSGSTLKNIDFTRKFEGINFSHCNLENINFFNCTFDRESFTSLRKSILASIVNETRVNMEHIFLKGDFSGVDFSMLNLASCDFQKVTNVSAAKFSHTILIHSTIPETLRRQNEFVGAINQETRALGAIADLEALRKLEVQNQEREKSLSSYKDKIGKKITAQHSAKTSIPAKKEAITPYSPSSKFASFALSIADNYGVHKLLNQGAKGKKKPLGYGLTLMIKGTLFLLNKLTGKDTKIDSYLYKYLSALDSKKCFKILCFALSKPRDTANFISELKIFLKSIDKTIDPSTSKQKVENKDAGRVIYELIDRIIDDKQMSSLHISNKKNRFFASSSLAFVMGFKKTQADALFKVLDLIAPELKANKISLKTALIDPPIGDALKQRQKLLEILNKEGVYKNLGEAAPALIKFMTIYPTDYTKRKSTNNRAV